MQQQWSESEKQAIKTFSEGDPNENPWVNGQPNPQKIEVLPYSHEWPLQFIQEKNRIKDTLGNIAKDIVHVGSTAVVSLAAKPIIDIDLVVTNPCHEETYVPLLNGLGYELTIREPSWYEHRMLKLLSPNINLHVFAENCPEHHRHILFKQWLLTHPEDLNAYAAIKSQALLNTQYMHQYNQNKQNVIREIYQKIFANL